jgi:hypothetical protein
MASIDGLRQQVEELKQRLNDPGRETDSGPDDLKARLATIKASLEGKQNEIARLTAEKERLAAEKERLAAEQQQVSAENDQLRKLLGEVLAVIDGKSAEGPTKILREFLAETDPLIKPADGGSRDAGAASRPTGQALTVPAKSETAAAGAAGNTATAQTPTQQAPDGEGEGDEEVSPALRRIMKRGHRAG